MGKDTGIRSFVVKNIENGEFRIRFDDFMMVTHLLRLLSLLIRLPKTLALFAPLKLKLHYTIIFYAAISLF